MSSYIYTLSEKSDGDPKYIGYSKAPWARFSTHLATARKQRTAKECWLFSVDGPVYCRILHRCDTTSPQMMERFFIAAARNFGISLKNGTEGGDGIPNPSEALKARISERTRIAMRRPEVREKLSGPRGRASREYPPQAPESRARGAEKLRLLWTTKQFREKMGARRRAEVTDEFREKMRAIAARQWNDPEFRARNLTARKKVSKC